MTDDGRMVPQDHREVTAEIVAAYVANNPVPHTDLPALIVIVHDALASLGEAAPVEVPPPLAEPAVSAKRSIQHDAITCMSCGKRFKTLKRHLMADHDMTPQDYRKRWSLPHDYPMVAPDYAERRSELAIHLQLGRQRRPRPTE